ncbi:hypothetical protein T12_2314 [Trichinella patagoniensis]|uniref:Uncharacterized protein n=1 Tax=Trichinella patagoniensis TaxID=990121 RepID=A0A0V0ZV41_9BILA|nr:hypothetical protein T12_2314 [Trichinella patagoniensis]
MCRVGCLVGRPNRARQSSYPVRQRKASCRMLKSQQLVRKSWSAAGEMASLIGGRKCIANCWQRRSQTLIEPLVETKQKQLLAQLLLQPLAKLTNDIASSVRQQSSGHRSLYPLTIRENWPTGIREPAKWNHCSTTASVERFDSGWQPAVDWAVDSGTARWSPTASDVPPSDKVHHPRHLQTEPLPSRRIRQQKLPYSFPNTSLHTSRWNGQTSLCDNKI